MKVLATTNWAPPFQPGGCIFESFVSRERREKGKKVLLGYEQGPTVNSSKDHQESEREISSAAWGGEGGWLNRTGGDPEGERERN